jgi:intraflagellar transport protein 52
LYRNKEEISLDRLSDADLAVFGGSREPFTAAEFKELNKWLMNGGRAMILVGDGVEAGTGSNINYFLEEYALLFYHLSRSKTLLNCFYIHNRFGISVNSDCVTRSAFYKYLHPKEVFIAEGILVPDIARKKVKRLSSYYFFMFHMDCLTCMGIEHCAIG